LGSVGVGFGCLFVVGSNVDYVVLLEVVSGGIEEFAAAEVDVIYLTLTMFLTDYHNLAAGGDIEVAGIGKSLENGVFIVLEVVVARAGDVANDRDARVEETYRDGKIFEEAFFEQSIFDKSLELCAGEAGHMKRPEQRKGYIALIINAVAIIYIALSVVVVIALDFGIDCAGLEIEDGAKLRVFCCNDDGEQIVTLNNQAGIGSGFFHNTGLEILQILHLSGGGTT